MAFRSNGGHIAGEDISAYVDEELSPAETSRVYIHLQSCDQCTALADDMRATQTLVRSMPLVRAPREFTLGPEFDVAASRQPAYNAPKRRWFNFMPAVAMSAAVLMLLVFADLSSLSLGGVDESSSSASSSAGRTVQDTAKSASESANAPQPPPVAPRQTQPAPNGAGGNTQSTQGFGATPAPQAAAAPPAAGTPSVLTAPAAIPPPVTTPARAIASGAAQAPTPPSNAVIVAADEAGEGTDDGGDTTLRVLEIIAAVVLLGSLGGLYWQRRRGV
jgi:hypothetical protein